MKFFILTWLIAVSFISCNSQPSADYIKSQHSGIDSVYTDNALIQNLAVVCKVWGFVKYYHPEVAAGKFKMDWELFSVMQKVIQGNNSAERNRVLSTWLEKFGVTTRAGLVKPANFNIKMEPDFSWMNVSELGDTLYNRLKAILQSKRKDGDYHLYFEITGQVKNVVIRNEERFDYYGFPDAGIRLLALFRYWNIIHYFFPYKYLIDENWNDVLVKYIPRFIDSKSELEYKLNVLSLIAQVRDTHANIYTDSTINDFKGRNKVPVDIRFIENKAVVNGRLVTKDHYESPLVKGDILDSVNGKSVKELIALKLPYTCASNNSTALRNIAMELLQTNDTVLNVALTRNGIKQNILVRTESLKSIDIGQLYQRKDTCFKLVTPDIGYLYPGNIKNEYLPKLSSEILKTKGLIIDLRCYPSEFIVFTLGEYLMPDPIEFVKFSKTEVQNPGRFIFTPPLKVGKSTFKYYKGKVVILINEITQSQAEYTTMALRNAPGAVVIGSTTAGADGNISYIQLPGGIHTVISGIGVYYPNGKETQRIGIVPDLEVKPTIKGVRENRDELLEKAIEIISKDVTHKK